MPVDLWTSKPLHLNTIKSNRAIEKHMLRTSIDFVFCIVTARSRDHPRRWEMGEHVCVPLILKVTVIVCCIHVVVSTFFRRLVIFNVLCIVLFRIFVCFFPFRNRIQRRNTKIFIVALHPGTLSHRERSTHILNHLLHALLVRFCQCRRQKLQHLRQLDWFCLRPARQHLVQVLHRAIGTVTQQIDPCNVVILVVVVKVQQRDEKILQFFRALHQFVILRCQHSLHLIWRFVCEGVPNPTMDRGPDVILLQHVFECHRRPRVDCGNLVCPGVIIIFRWKIPNRCRRDAINLHRSTSGILQQASQNAHPLCPRFVRRCREKIFSCANHHRKHVLVLLRWHIFR
eukprot:m.77690 g.77690  ORF g.77690 m.77690 type:complete len:342 (-) comp16204_c0_seq7:847-1872(-)